MALGEDRASQPGDYQVVSQLFQPSSLGDTVQTPPGYGPAPAPLASVFAPLISRAMVVLSTIQYHRQVGVVGNDTGCSAVDDQEVGRSA